MCQNEQSTAFGHLPSNVIEEQDLPKAFNDKIITEYGHIMKSIKSFLPSKLKRERTAMLSNTRREGRQGDKNYQ
jgi:hypothetical protein